MKRRALVCGQLVGEQVGVGGHDGVAHFDGPAVGVVGRADKPEHGDAGGEAQQPSFLRRRHPGADLLGEARQRMPAFFQPRVYPAWARVGISDRRTARQVGGDVRHGSFHGLAVKRVPPRAYDNAVTVGQTEALGYIGRRAGFIHLDHVYRRIRCALLSFGQERGFAFLAVPLRKAIRGQSPYRRLRAYIHAPAMLGRDQTLVLEDTQGIADRHASDAVVVHQRCFGRQLLTLPELARTDRGAQVIGDLPVNGTVAARIDVLGQHTAAAHAGLAPQLVHTSTTVSVPGEDKKISTSHAKHSVSVAGVIVDDQNRTLLIRRRDNHHWEPPGGVLELHESIEHGLRREIREETGLNVEPIALTGIYKNMKRGIVALVFRCTVLSGELKSNSEVSDFRWATSADVGSMANEAFAVRILDALAHNSTPAIRQHDGIHLT
jgi:8-oxo-dGTP diphosphatase